MQDILGSYATGSSRKKGTGMDLICDERLSDSPFTVTFEEYNGQTKLTSRAQFASAADLEAVLGMGMAEGITETWDRLEAYLASV
jgi:uncharacterized protein YndB with AHSA1/START domain